MENKQSRSAGSRSTVTLMPASAEAPMEQITLQIRNHLEQLLGQFLRNEKKRRPSSRPNSSLTLCEPLNMYQLCLSATIVIYLLKDSSEKNSLFLFFPP